MAATNTPIPDLVELSSIGANRTYTAAPGGGGDIIGVVDNGTYTDSDGSNSATQLAELNDNGILTIDGVDYTIQIAVPDSSSDDVTITYDGGASSVDLGGSGASSNVVLITASPIGGGSDRYFIAIDDGIGDLPDITSIQTRDLDFTPAGNDVQIDLDQDQNVGPICFTPGARIMTPKGPVPVETLVPGDHVSTLDAGDQPILWIRRRQAQFTETTDSRKPVEIKPGALGPDTPFHTLVVSPQHRILLTGGEVQRLFGEPEVLAPAKWLTGMPGIRIKRGKRTETYINLLLDRHQILHANGARAESFYPGPTALRMLTPCERQTLETHVSMPYGPPARRVLDATETADLVAAIAARRRPVMRPKASGSVARVA